MCGIAGEINFNARNTAITQENAASIIDTLKRRGPDQSGVYLTDFAALLHTRLAVIDPENGLQPMVATYGEKEYCIVYNGELYNTKELRDRLLDSGHKFLSHSDTEVVLKAYIEWGDNFVRMLNGIFAFAIWDKAGERLFFGRDRMGVKPFFFSTRGLNDGDCGKVFRFASEIKALLAFPGFPAEIDAGSVAEIFLIGPGRTPGYGVFKGIHELKPAHCGSFSRKGLRIYPYWKLEDHAHDDTFEQTAEKVRFLVTDAIERQLVSDVPICTFLSGGLDSSIISAVASRKLREAGERLDTFSVHYPENEKYFKPGKFQPDSDDKYIDIMAEYLGSRHHKVFIDSDDLVEALYDAVDARDLPGMADVDSSLLLFCREIKKHATVALSGECADEIFGGYPWYRDESIRSRDGFPWSQTTGYRRSFIRDELIGGIDPCEYVYERYRQTVEETGKMPGLSPTESRMKEMVNLNLQWFMQTLLDRKDRMSMYSGLEVRVPFCDYRIVEYMYTVPWEMKEYRGREKGLLRAAMRDLLPEEILWRKKSPYPKTHHPGYRAKLSRILRNIIADPTSRLLDIAKKSELEKLLETNRELPWYGQLMTTPQTIAYMIQINYWMDKYRIRIV